MILRYLSETDLKTGFLKQNMFEISKTIKKSRPADLFKKIKQDTPLGLTSQEMLKVSQNISLYFSPRIEPSKPNLTLLPVDPQHLYAYWVLDGQSSNKLAYSLLKDQLVLRVYSRSSAEGEIEKNLSVEKTIHDFQSQKLIKLPGSGQVIDYSASIGKLNSKKAFDPLIKSNTMPAQQNSVLSRVPNGYQTQLMVDEGSSELVTLVKSHYASRNPSGQIKKPQL